VHGLECGAGIGAEFVTQRAAVSLIPGQRRGRSHRRRLTAQQLQQHLLIPQALTEQIDQRLDRLAAAAEPRQSQRTGPHQRPIRRCPFSAQRGQRIIEHGAAARGAIPHRETRISVRKRRRVVAGTGVPCARGRAEQDSRGIDLVRAQGQPVTGRCAGDDAGAQLGPGAGHENLQRLDRVLGLPVRPEALHQPGGAAARTQVGSQEREETTHPGTGDLLAAVGHPRQQGQFGGHPARLASHLTPSTATPQPGQTCLRRRAQHKIVPSRQKPRPSAGHFESGTSPGQELAISVSSCGCPRRSLYLSRPPRASAKFDDDVVRAAAEQIVGVRARCAPWAAAGRRGAGR
jgi:hypothetical protein